MTRRTSRTTPKHHFSRRQCAGIVVCVLAAALLCGSSAGAAVQQRAPAEAIVSAAFEPSAQAADLRTVDGYVSAWIEAVRAYDVDRWASLVDEDVVMMAPDGRVVEGRDAFHELWSRSFEGQTGTNPLHVEVLDRRITEGTAMLRAHYGPIGAEPVGQYVWMLERDSEGRWSMAWWIFNRRSAR